MGHFELLWYRRPFCFTTCGHLIATGDICYQGNCPRQQPSQLLVQVLLVIADRLMGQRRAVFWGVLVCSVCALALPFGAPTMFASMVLIVMGLVFVEAKRFIIVADHFMGRRFSARRWILNLRLRYQLGFIYCPSWTQKQSGFHLAFSLAAIGMFFGLIEFHFLFGKHLSRIHCTQIHCNQRKLSLW